MSTQFTKDQVLKLAELANLQLSDSEVERYQKELSAILEYFERLNEVDISGLEPTYQVSGLVNVMREDVPKLQQATPDTLLERTPHVEGRYIKVGRMV